MKPKALLRIRLISGCIILVALVFIGRLYVLQIVHGSEFADRADRQYARPSQGIFNRGSIFFSARDGTLVSAATLKTGFVLAINPKLISDPDDTYAKLSAILPLDADIFKAKAAKKTDPYEEIVHHVEAEAGEKITALAIPGVTLYRERWRYYPDGTIAPQTIGFLGFKGADTSLTGRYGLERYYEDVLQREDDSAYTNFFAEVFSNIGTAVFKNEAARGDTVLTIEPTVQVFLDNELKKVNDKYRGRQAAGIVINPKNGEIYAMGVFPSFDLNNFQKEKDVNIFANPLLEDVFEMGSIVKALTMAAGLDAGAVTPNTTYNDKGSITLNGKKISNFDGKARGVVPMQTILDDSLNTGATFVMQQMGKDLFSEYFYNYGLGERTGIDLPNESIGLVNNLKSPREVEHATASFGQGIAVSPVAITRALATLSNGGYLIRPHLVKEINYTLGYTKDTPVAPGRQVLKPATSEAITRMLVSVVDTALLGGTVKMPNYTIAAKTGTAQIAKENGGGYYTDRYLHTFFGYFPAYDPKFLVFLYIREPHGEAYASHTLTAPFINITKFLIDYYEVPPDR